MFDYNNEDDVVEAVAVINWTDNRKATARKLITASRMLAGQLDKKGQIKDEFGMYEAVSEKGVPVCAFGQILAQAGVISPSMFGESGNEVALASALRLKSREIPEHIIMATENIAGVNDDTTTDWDKRRKNIARELRNFAKVLEKDAFPTVKLTSVKKPAKKRKR